MTTRPTLLQCYLKYPSAIVEDFESASGWAAVYHTGTIALDQIHFKTGSGAVKFTTTYNGSVIYQKTISVNITASVVDFWYYIDSLDDLSSIQIRFSSVADLSKYATSPISLVPQHAGWNHAIIPVSGFVMTGGELWTNTMIRLYIIVFNNANRYPVVTVDSIAQGVTTHPPMCILSFDDFTAPTYATVFSICTARGIRGTLFANTTAVGAVGRMTLAQIVEMEAAGWTVAVHTVGHVDLTTLTEAQIIAEMGTVRAWMTANNFTRGQNHMAYANGAHNAGVRATLSSLGFLTSRTTTTGNSFPVDARDYLMMPVIWQAWSDLATAKSAVDFAVLTGQSFHMWSHSVDGVGEWTTADFTSLLDYMISRGIIFVTIDEWYNGLTNPRYRSLPVTRATV